MQQSLEAEGIDVVGLRKGFLEFAVELDDLSQMDEPAFAAMRVRTRRKEDRADVSSRGDVAKDADTLWCVGADESAVSARKSISMNGGLQMRGRAGRTPI